MVGALALVAIAAAGFFLIRSEQQLSRQRAAARAFDLHAREATDALSDLRASQQAYVAAGQGVAFWMPKVAATAETSGQIISSLRQAATSQEARAALDEAANTLTEFNNVDKRARDYLKSDQQLMAADVVYTEGGPAAVVAARQVERARLAEHQALDASEAASRQLEAAAMATAAVVGLMAIALLISVGKPTPGSAEAPAEPRADDLMLHGDLGRQPVPASAAREAIPILKGTAQLCTDFARVSDLAGLTALLGPAAELMDASGLVVWLGNASGADLRPVLAHGYSEQALARMAIVPRSANNAAAAAYRAATLQIVLARPGVSSGAIVAPLLSPDGCIGALSAEITGGGETSDTIQALAAIFAAQLSGVLSTSTAPQSGQKAAGL
jgi:CHASE3 domain sensor protein